MYMYAPMPRRYIVPLLCTLATSLLPGVHTGAFGLCKCCNAACTQLEYSRFAKKCWDPRLFSAKLSRACKGWGAGTTSVARCVAELYDWLGAALHGQPWFPSWRLHACTFMLATCLS